MNSAKLKTEEGQEVAIIDLFHVEGEECRDLKSSEECSAFEPTCNIMAGLGYRYCRKTCQFCESKIQRSTCMWNIFKSNLICAHKGRNIYLAGDKF